MTLGSPEAGLPARAAQFEWGGAGWTLRNLAGSAIGLRCEGHESLLLAPGASVPLGGGSFVLDVPGQASSAQVAVEFSPSTSRSWGSPNFATAEGDPVAATREQRLGRQAVLHRSRWALRAPWPSWLEVLATGSASR